MFKLLFLQQTQNEQAKKFISCQFGPSTKDLSPEGLQLRAMLCYLNGQLPEAYYLFQRLAVHFPSPVHLANYMAITQQVRRINNSKYKRVFAQSFLYKVPAKRRPAQGLLIRSKAASTSYSDQRKLIQSRIKVPSVALASRSQMKSTASSFYDPVKHKLAPESRGEDKEKLSLCQQQRKEGTSEQFQDSIVQSSYVKRSNSKSNSKSKNSKASVDYIVSGTKLKPKKHKEMTQMSKNSFAAHQEGRRVLSRVIPAKGGVVQDDQMQDDVASDLGVIQEKIGLHRTNTFFRRQSRNGHPKDKLENGRTKEHKTLLKQSFLKPAVIRSPTLNLSKKGLPLSIQHPPHPPPPSSPPPKASQQAGGEKTPQNIINRVNFKLVPGNPKIKLQLVKAGTDTGPQQASLSRTQRSTAGKMVAKELKDLQAKLSPDDPESYKRLANLHLALGRNRQAASFLEKTLSLNEKDEEAILILLKIYLEEGSEQLLKEVLPLLSKVAQSPSRTLIEAEFWYKMNSLEKAEQICRKNLGRNSRYSLLLIRILRKRGDIKQAVRLSMSCLHAWEDAEIKAEAAELFSHCKEFEFAQLTLLKLAQQQPENEALQLKLGLLYKLKGDTRKAKHFLSAAYALAPENQQIMRPFISLLVELGERKAAIKKLQQQAKQKECPTCVIVRLLELKEGESAAMQRLELLERVQDNLSQNQLNWHRANILYDQHQFSAAMSLYLRVQGLNARNSDLLLFRLANLYALEKQYLQATQLYSRIESSPWIDQSLLLYNMGNLFMLSGQLELAQDCLSRVKGELYLGKAEFNLRLVRTLLSQDAEVKLAVRQAVQSQPSKFEWRQTLQNISSKMLI